MDHLARIRALGLSAERFGRLTGTHRVTICNWGRSRSGRGVQAVPAWVPRLLDAWEAHPQLLADADEGE
jgi:hypothetical protein